MVGHGLRLFWNLLRTGFRSLGSNLERESNDPSHGRFDVVNLSALALHCKIVINESSHKVIVIRKGSIRS